MIIANLRTSIVVIAVASTEVLMTIEIPREVQNALWGLAILAITLLGIWAKSAVSSLAARHDLELKTIRDNQEQSKQERAWLLETTKTQVLQISSLQVANNGLTDGNRQRDMEIGELKATNGELERRTNERHEAINEAQAKASEALILAEKAKNRADAAEGDLAEAKRELDKLKAEILAVKIKSRLVGGNASDETVA